MSYILDALRKSERERRHTDPLNVGDDLARPPELRQGRGMLWGIVAAVLLVGAVVALSYFFWPSVSPTTSTLPAPVGPTSSAPVPATSEEIASTSAPAVSPLRAETAIRQPAAPPALKPNAFAAPSEPSVRNLAKETRVEPPKLPATATTPSPLPGAYAPPRVTATDGIKFLAAMPPEFRQGLPELAVNIHIYSPTPAERILYINNRQYQAGDKIRDDLWVEDIVEDGALMNRNGQRFKLPRPR